MTNNFWKNLPKPFFVLAPLEDVTDAAFRRLIAKYGKPHVFYTEFTSADGLVKAPAGRGRESLLKKLEYSETERPIVAQLFSAVPAHMEVAAALVRQLGFDGVDINMGCPDKKVEKQLCGAAMIKDPPLAREIIRAAKRGARTGESGGIPVSVKTRIGYNTNELDTWLPELLAEEPAAVAIHARTRKEMSKVPARWEHIKEVVAIRDFLGSSARIIGNGDVQDLNDARAKAAEAGCDGVMLGRAIFGSPWLFADRTHEPTPGERIQALAEHIRLFDELLGGYTSFAIMKKHFKAYIQGWSGAKELRSKLMDTNSPEEARVLLEYALLGEGARV